MSKAKNSIKECPVKFIEGFHKVTYEGKEVVDGGVVKYWSCVCGYKIIKREKL